MRSKSNTKSDAVKILGIDQPIIQGPFGGGLSSINLAAAVANKGGLGSFGAVNLSPDAIIQTAQNIRAKTDGVFNLNLWVSKSDIEGDAPTASEMEKYWQLFRPYYEEMGLEQPDFSQAPTISFEQQVEALLEARPHVFSFVFGIPSKSILAECRRRKIVTLGNATSIAEAEALHAAGVDMIIATGSEAGGHRVSFLGDVNAQLMGTFALTQLIARRVPCPVIAAGGIVDASGIQAVLALGAQAAQLGTAFLACDESGTSKAHRDALFSTLSLETTLTRAYTGRVARGLKNRWTEEMAERLDDIAPYPVQAWFFNKLKESALASGRTDLFSLYGGQAAPNLSHRRATDLMDDLIAGLQ